MEQQQTMIKKPELLSPAGSLEAFFAAMEKGADAVYAGLKDFSARAKAKNFTLQQMERLIAYAHAHRRKVYVTINTLIKEAELPRLIEVLGALETMRVDGVILQDLAVYRLIRDFFPGIPLHASTQMTIHNSLGVKQLEEMGFSRIVLARELHLDEIRQIVRSTNTEIECFIHGALCFSFSGQCYFSSFLGGHSGNRGRCAQPCRRQYRYRGKEGYYFSTNDFSSIDLVPELVEAGVASFKIEGRMKSAEYVASVVGAYRLVLDAVPERRQEAVASAKELLKLSFGRVPTKGFLASQNPPDIATPTLKGATGRFLGELKSIKGDRITFETRDSLHVGDRIRVQPKTDMAGRAFTIKELLVGGKKLMAARERSLVTVISPFPFKVGDAVFKVSSETAFTMSETACLKRLEAVKQEKIPCELSLTLDGDVLQVIARAGKEINMTFPIGPVDSSTTTDMEGVLRAQFSRTGDTPFELTSFSAPGFPAVFIPPARLKEIRRDVYKRLEIEAVSAVKSHQRDAVARALAALVGKRPPKEERRPEVLVKGGNVRDLGLLYQDGVDAVVLPVAKATLHQLAGWSRKLRGRENRVMWRLPFIIFDAEVPFYREGLKYLIELGFRRFELANLSHFQLLAGCNVEKSADYRLFSLNSQALAAWQELGVSTATLYIEDDADNMAELLAADLSIRRRILIFGEVPAITSKIRIKAVRDDAPVMSDRGDAYRVEVREGHTVVSPVTPFSLTHFRGKLQEAGCSSFALDLAGMTDERRRQVLEAFTRGSKLEGTSEFNFTLGLV